MGGWRRAMDAAGIRDPRLREDYTRQLRRITRYRREVALASRVLLPLATLPHVIAAAAFMHHTDTLLDSGPAHARHEAAARWARDTTEALDTGRTDHPELRPLLHSAAAHPSLRAHVRAHLDAAPVDLDFAGFTDEADHRGYVDAYSLPGFMVVAGVLGPAEDPDGAFRAACREYIDAAQLLDFVNDLSEDLADDRLTLPTATLARHGVTRAELEAGADTPAVRALLTELLDRVDAGLLASRPVVDLVPPAHRPMVRCLLGVDALTSRAARAAGPALLRGPASPGKPAAVRLLWRELRAKRAGLRESGGNRLPGRAGS
ncbi:phytoene/squalene synthase family protein (plasmid) [Streptomyces sp. BI20]|uniref:phytoene/squalene synthase family protein n=1 Tax=Streptomyces sp. BI20 TaxID=3403460 RepID=UPI003C749DC7